MREPEQHAPSEATPDAGGASAGRSDSGSSRSFRPRLSAANLVTPTDEYEFEPRSPAGLEAVVVGHLPSRAGPWVAQYARALSEQIDEPVGLVRLAADRLSLDVIGIGLDDGGVGESSSFKAAAASIGGRVGAWLISASDLAEPELCLDPRISRVTLLCTNDDSGILATYRTIRQLMAWDTTPRSVGVAPLGVEVHSAEALWTRLREATKELLDGNLELAAFVERMGPTGAAAVYWTDTPEPLEEVLAALEEASGATPSEEPERAASGLDLDEDISPVAKIDPEPGFGAADEPVSDGGGPPVPGRVVSREKLSRPETVSPRAIIEPLPATPGGASGRDGGGGVAELIPGLRRLSIACPVDASIEVATDDAGGLHVVLLDDPERAAYRLHAAARWVRLNAELIARACGDCGAAIDIAREPTVHLVVRGGVLVEPALALDWRVHLLIERQSDGMSVRVLEPLRG